MTKQYLGDSVYAEYDGYHICLTTENGTGVADNRIYIEPPVLAELIKYAAEVYKSKKPPSPGEGDGG